MDDLIARMIFAYREAVTAAIDAGETDYDEISRKAMRAAWAVAHEHDVVARVIGEDGWFRVMTCPQNGEMLRLKGGGREADGYWHEGDRSAGWADRWGHPLGWEPDWWKPE